MISIRNSANAIDRLDDLQKETASCYSWAIQSIGEYAIDIDPEDHARFRAHLRVIEEQWRAAAAPADMRSIQASLRGELREYRDQSRDRLTNLHRQLDDNAAALSLFIAGIESNGATHEDSMDRELKRLKTAAAGDDLGQVRSAIHQAVSGIGESIERTHRENLLLTLHLRDEIRTLHREFQAERRALYTDSQSGAWNRQKLDARIDDLVRQNQFFCLLFVAVPNLKTLEHNHPRDIIDDALKALVKRFCGTVGPEIVVGRWSHDAFMAIMDVPASEAIPVSGTVQKSLGGRYTVQKNAESLSIGLKVTTAVVDRGEATDAEAFRRKLDQLADALANS